MSDNEVEEVSFLPGENLNRKSYYEPSPPQRCKQLVCSQGRATAIIVIVGIFILTITIIASFARPGSFPCQDTNLEQTTAAPVTTTPGYIATNGEVFPWKNVRLPRNIIPLTYDIFLHPNITTGIFTGKVNIVARIESPTDFLVFHAKDLNITDFSVHLRYSGHNILAKKFLEYRRNMQRYVRLERELADPDEIILQIKYQGKLSDSLSGFYKSSYKNKHGITRYLATTHFQPTEARAAFPCFDEPDLKANFSLSMVRDKDYISLFNMPLASSEPYMVGAHSYYLDKFQSSVKMSTYLVAFVVCDYANLTDKTEHNTTVRVFAPPDQIHQAKFALKAAVKVLDYYDSFFGEKYPLPKQDLIAIPDFAAGAMENWGLITYRLTAILYDEKVSSVGNKQWVAVVVAHELAHQWFGNLVTMKWWDDLWLNEGFASFVEYIGSDIVEKDWHMGEQFVIDDMISAMYLDSLKNSHPIQIHVTRPDQINEIFDSISYSKGASLVRMLQNILGEEVFQAGLIDYLQAHKFSNAETRDLWDAMTMASHTIGGVNVSSVMDTWTQQMGFPVVTLRKNGQTVTATQKRFLLYPQSSVEEEFVSPFNYKWYIPFNYVTSTNQKDVKRVWMNKSSVTFQVPADTQWVKGNAGMYGYFRVNYEDEMWHAIIQQLNKNHTVFSPTDRAGFIDDVFQLARAGLVQQKIALDLTEYLLHEDNYVPWRAALDNLAYIKFRLQNKPVYSKFKKYMLQLLSRLVTKLGWEDRGQHLERYLRAVVLKEAIELGHQETVDKGKQLFRKWMNDTSSISPNLKLCIYMAGVEYGGMEEWDFMWDQYQNVSVPSEKRKLLTTLGRTRDARLLNRLLKYSLKEDKIRSQDTSSVISVVADNPGGQVLAWRFFKQNWKTLEQRYGDVSFTWLD
ncbi:hypothetical protein ScPMuIL_003063 [Solemya velum]